MNEIPIPRKHDGWKLMYEMGYEHAIEGRDQLPTTFFSYSDQFYAYRDGYEAGKTAREELNNES